MTSLVILQPGYLPWLGFFDQLERADLFIYYDDVQYDTSGWRNRNRIKSSSGIVWLTIPVKHKGLNRPIIKEIVIDESKIWAKKQIKSIRQYYSKSPYIDLYLPELEILLCKPWKYLIDLNVASTALFCTWLGIDSQIEFSSSHDIGGDKTERLINFCELFNASKYLSGDSAKSYLDLELFNNKNIEVEWQNYKHPEYAQQHGEFISHLSILDLLLNMGESSKSILVNYKRD